ncbi:MAG TPA: UDPGP type 1 family protein [Planctomycetaceae bacterium]|jgi:UDP-N-acetylglucosamine/UDP-N-acetylgalactosamine diphosphorylase|nr:UDPGP type 1 family protein [Planctomycetaceae bacterium]
MNRDLLADRLRPYSQDHALRWWSELNTERQRELAAQLEALDLDWLRRQQNPAPGQTEEPAAEKAQRARPPSDLVRLPASAADREAWAQARETGRELLKAGRVGAILVAGGEATRLGYEYPKGMYPIGVVSNKTLFELLAEQLRARATRAGAAIPSYVMTSSATHNRTVAYFGERQFLGLDPTDVHFFRQGNLPAVDLSTGKLLLAEKHQLALNPDGHGGLLAALSGAGLLEDMRRRGVDYLFYFQVDNPLVKVCDPAFLGFHALRESEVSTKVVAKLSAEEKMGVAVEVDGRTQIIEYSDLPAEVSRERDERGGLKFWAGSTAIHVFSRSFLERLERERIELPVHRAVKKVPHLDEAGRRVTPETENAVKYERFIFDVLPLAERALVVEASRNEEFCPLKNKTGDFSPPHVQQSLSTLHGNWLRSAGITVAPGLPVEIAPLYALDADELAARVDRSLICGGPVHLEG